VLKCGGGKALTKNAAGENTLKCHMDMEEMNKIGESTNLLAVCGAQAHSKLEEKIDVVPAINEVKPKRNKLGKIMPELYNIENCVETEKPVKIDLDLDLYQMEKV
jgi:hypothetical protein